MYLGNEKLKLIANELLHSVCSNATIDWHHSEMARAKIRVAVKRIKKIWLPARSVIGRHPNHFTYYKLC
jgi:hypothetical protein